MSRDTSGRARDGRRWWLGAAAVALVLAAVVSFYASSAPDGLERVADDEGFGGAADDHDLADGPLADYGVESVDDERVSVGLAGIAGVGVTLAVGAGLFRLVRRPDRGGPDAADEIDLPGVAGDDPPGGRRRVAEPAGETGDGGRPGDDGARVGHRMPERRPSGDRGV